MAKILTTVPSDTSTGGQAVVLTLPSLNYGEDFRATCDDAGHVELTNVTAALDAPENFTFKQNTIKNVYSGTGIDSTSQSPVKRGIHVMAQCKEVWRKTDDTDSTYEVLLPVSARIITNIPADSCISADDVLALQLRAIASQFDTTKENVNLRIEQMIRGALMPSAL